jgi:hypothetical protein
MSGQRWRIVAIAAFFALLCAPALQQRFAVVPIPALDENRTRAARPSFADVRWDALPAWFAGWERWVEDHDGFRDLLIRLKNDIRYRVFRTATHIVIGRRGWLYYKSEQRDFANAEGLYAEHRAALFARLTALREQLAARGIDLWIMPIPEKQTFYPEFFPERSYPRPSPNFFDEFRAELSHRGFRWVDPMPALLVAKKRRPVFYKTDFHWNEFGAAVGGRALVDAISRAAGRPPYRSTRIQAVPLPYSTGGQAQALGLFVGLSETTATIRRQYEACSRPIASPDFRWGFEATDACGPVDARLPSTLVFGDSFSDVFSKTDFPTYFTRLVQRHLDDFAPTYDALPPDVKIVVLEFIEAAMPRILLDQNNLQIWWPATVSDAALSRMPGSTPPSPVCAVAHG